MSDFEAWNEFRRGERVDRRQPKCCGCGGPATGSITMDEKGPDGRTEHVCGKCDAEWTGEAAVIAAALAAGWTYEKSSLYDEEGVEGFEWAGPDGKTCTSHARDGGWENGPEPPDAVRELFDGRRRKAAQERQAEVMLMTGFLNRLLFE